jgi:SseB protein N-terminal domain
MLPPVPGLPCSCLRALARSSPTVGDVPGISGGDPTFLDDDGSAHPAVVSALAGFAAGRGSEHAVMTALAASRLLVPVVAVLADEPSATGPQAGPATRFRSPGQGEKGSEMAMPTLIGLDGRSAIPAFTCLDSLKRWQSDARPVPVAASAVWQTACADSAAVVVDVAGPVPFALEGARLAALARGSAPPLPHCDPDVRELVAAVVAGQDDIAGFELEPGGEHDLAIVLVLTEEATARRSEQDIAEIGGAVVRAVMDALGGRLPRGVAIWLDSPSDTADQPAR